MLEGGEEADGLALWELGDVPAHSCPVPARRHGAGMRDRGGFPGQASPIRLSRGDLFPAVLSRQDDIHGTLAYSPNLSLEFGVIDGAF